MTTSLDLIFRLPAPFPIINTYLKDISLPLLSLYFSLHPPLNTACVLKLGQMNPFPHHRSYTGHPTSDMTRTWLYIKLYEVGLVVRLYLPQLEGRAGCQFPPWVGV